MTLLSVSAAAAEGAPPAGQTESADDLRLNNGEDFTRPVWQLEIKERYENLLNSDGRSPSKWFTTLRGDAWIGLGEGWKLYGRMDVPLVHSNEVTSSFNPDGNPTFGLGDLLTEVAVIMPPPSPYLDYGVGLRIVWPSGSLNEAGTGKLQIGPVGGVRVNLPVISPGSFFLAELRYMNSVSSRNENKGRSDVNQLQIQPKLNIDLPDGWYVTAYASEAIEINLADDGKLFVPLDILVGKRIADHWNASLEYSRVLIHDNGFEPYQWQLEGRVAYKW